MENNIHNLSDRRNKLTYDLRQELDRWEELNNRSTSEFDATAVGLAKDKVSRIEAELDKVEAELSRSVADKKAKEREAELAQPEYDSKHRFADATGDEYNKRFSEALFSGNRIALDRLMNERTSVTTGATNTSAAVPVEWQNRIVEKINQFNIMRQVCPVRTVGADQKIVIGGALPTAYKVAEGNSITEDTTFAVSNVDVLDLTYACYVPVSKQYTQDAIGGLDYVSRKAGEAIGNLLENEYTNGAAGAGNMPGVLSYAGSFGTVDTGTDFAGWQANTGGASSDLLIELAHLVAPQYRQGAGFMMSDAIAKTVRKFKTTVGEYIWKTPDRYADIRDGMPSTIYGFPVYINQTMETVPAGNEVFMLFGNFGYYEIYDRGTDVMIDPYGLSTSLMNRLVVSQRTYGVCTNTDAFATLTL
jgi:HK97 family phage major capsid protein